MATSFQPRAPPPTFNTLDARQRTRLIRSTRKLGAVLGTTPQLLETDSPLSPPSSSSKTAFSPKRDRKRRQGSIFEFPPSASPFSYSYASSSASSSASSLALPRPSLESIASTESDMSLPAPTSFARHIRDKSLSKTSGAGKGKGKRAPLPTPLVLRLNAVPLPPSDPRVQPPTPSTAATIKTSALLSASSTSSSYTSAATTPTTPSLPVTPTTPTATETRRKRLAKLKRTLGENVPPELIMPFRSLRPHAHASPVDPPAAPIDPTPAAPLAPQKRQPQLYPQQRLSARAAAPEAHKQSTAPPARPVQNSAPSRRRSVSVDYTHASASGDHKHKLAGFEAVPKPLPIPRTPHADYFRSWREPEGRHAYALPHLPSSHSSTRTSPTSSRAHSPERERVWVTGSSNWTGEWNRKDIREVQRQLRNLKLR